MRQAVEKLEAIYAKAGAADRFTARFHPTPHQFGIAMQEDAFAWLDRHLKPAGQ
jgi:hypothetical protein